MSHAKQQTISASDDSLLDSELTSAAAAMIEAAERGRNVTRILARRCPVLCRHIEKTRQAPQLLTRWGRSRNFDENARQEIVHPAILQAIGEIAGTPLTGKIVHAGLLHTYGYLFSLITTPYGTKRERWLSPLIDTAFGFGEPTLRAVPLHGTLFGNLTWFLSRMVHSNAMERVPPDLVADELRSYDYRHLIRSRIVEVPAATTALRHLQIQTDLVRFPRRRSKEADALLIYSMQSGAKARSRLFTAFPATAATVRDLEGSTGRAVPIRLRYNAYHRGFRDTVTGERRLVEFAVS